MDHFLINRSLHVPFALVVIFDSMFAVVCILFWYAALDPQINQAGPILHLTALCWTVLTLVCIPKLLENYHFLQLRYEFRENCIVLENKQEQYIFDLCQDFLVTRYTFRLAVGKASTCLPMFCLMRADSTYKFCSSDGIGPMKKFLRSGGILLPCSATSALMYATGLERIPEYPLTAACTGK